MKEPRWHALIAGQNFIDVMKTIPIKRGPFNIYKLILKEKEPQGYLGFILSKKQVKLAVVRNKIKRTVHEYVRQYSNKEPAILVIKAQKKITKKNLLEDLKLLSKSL